MKSFVFIFRVRVLSREVKDVRKAEKYFKGAEDEYTALETKLSPDKHGDLDKFKDEITLLLENEIVSRYYYQDGRIAQSLSSDPEIQGAINIIQDKTKYKDILAGNYKASTE